MGAKKEVNLNEVSKPLCSVAGMVAPGAMCGHILPEPITSGFK